ncbi:MAG: phosphodiesterase [Coriobacteriia bacterium]|nr:phosphodiesterase [Coriobacteriia bacterium]MBS5477763.1 phosphodiesterase [Coriobacteriia bacterium]
MRFVIASDIHGSATWCRALMAQIERESPDRVLLLGDLLYHGPRNDLPDGYAPKEVAAMLNDIAERIIAVRGNCEAEVDQMVLDFPCLADYTEVFDAGVPAGTPWVSGGATGPDVAGRLLFLTHGHVYGPGLQNSVDNLPKIPSGSGAALLYGHTHVKVCSPCPGRPDLWLLNPGSVSLPKDGTHSYATYEDGAFELRELRAE